MLFNSITASALPDFSIAPSFFFAPFSFLSSVVRLKLGCGLSVYHKILTNEM